ncbi:MAG: LysM peptidoglycan-binding domain-containing protein [Planctomycetaceae bacterium]
MTKCAYPILTLSAALAGTVLGCNSAPIHPGQAAVPAGGAAAERVAGDGNTERATGQLMVDGASEDKQALYHEVRAGEKLPDIAAIYGLTAQRLLLVNGLDAATGIKPGQLLYIPRSR